MESALHNRGEYKKEKNKLKERLSGFLTSDELTNEMDALLRHYGADRSQADLKKTKQILSKFNVSEALSAVREENR